MTITTTLKPGTIVGDTSTHGPGIRFGVVLAPEPSERVRRIISDDPAIWRPAVAELCAEVWGRVELPRLSAPTVTAVEDDDDAGFSARCDYCGRLFSPRKVAMYWQHTYSSAEGAGVFTTGIFCSEPCAEWSANRAGSSRG